MRITNQVVRFSLYIWNPSHPFVSLQRCSHALYASRKDALPVPVLTHITKIGDGALGKQPSRPSPLFFYLSLRAGQTRGVWGMSTELVPGRLSWGGAFPRLLCHRRQQNRAYDAMAFRTEVADETQSAGYRASLQRRRLAPGGAPSVEEVCPSLLKNVRKSSPGRGLKQKLCGGDHVFC